MLCAKNLIPNSQCFTRIYTVNNLFPLQQGRWKRIVNVLVLEPLPGGTGHGIFSTSLHVGGKFELVAAGPLPRAAWPPHTQGLLLLTTQFWTFKIILAIFKNRQEVIFFFFVLNHITDFIMSCNSKASFCLHILVCFFLIIILKFL